jgi:hypothetical protein
MYPHQKPPKEKHTARNILGIVGGIVVLIIIISVATGGGSKNSAATSSPAAADPGTSASSSFQASAAPSSAAPSPSAAFKAQQLLDVSGSSQYQTARYTVGGSGDYDIDWTYNEGTMGSQVNFQIYGDGGNDDSVTDPNQLGTGGSGVVHVYNDPGTHYLQVNSEGNWTLKVVTTP